MNRNEHMFDAIIVGASIAGSYMSNLLIEQGLKVALVESQSQPIQKACGEGLSLIGKKLLEHHGYWQDSFERMPLHGYNLKYESNSDNIRIKTKDPCIWGINRAQLIEALLTRAQRSPNLHMFSDLVMHIHKVSSTNFVVQSKDNLLEARSVIIAAGGNSIEKFYPHNLKFIKAKKHRIAVCFWLSGNWLNDNGQQVHIKCDHAMQLLLTPTSATRLNVNFLIDNSSKTKYSTSELASRAVAYATSLGFVTNHVKYHRGSGNIQYQELAEIPSDFFLVGDSACRFDPISGMGMTHALISAELASHKIVNHLSSNSKKASNIVGYYKSRKRHAQFLNAISKINQQITIKQNRLLIMLVKLLPNLTAGFLLILERSYTFISFNASKKNIYTKNHQLVINNTRLI